VSLNLEKNLISAAGANYLSKLIGNNQNKITLKELILSKNNIGNNAME